MNDFFVLAMMKNEEDILEEWIRHYQIFGATKIFIIDDNSTDGSLDICKKYPDFIEVQTVKDLPEFEGRQFRAYNIFFRKLLKYNNFALVCDIDEFAFPTKAKTLPEFCEQHSHVSELRIKRYVFSPNKNYKQPRSVIKSCFFRAEDDEDKLGKCIVKLNKVKFFFVHHCFVDGPSIDANLNEIKINHYIYQSKEQMLKRFLKGGGNRGRWPLNQKEALVMTEKRFRGNHFHKIEDRTLIDIYQNLGHQSTCIKVF